MKLWRETGFRRVVKLQIYIRKGFWMLVLRGRLFRPTRLALDVHQGKYICKSEKSMSVHISIRKYKFLYETFCVFYASSKISRAIFSLLPSLFSLSLYIYIYKYNIAIITWEEFAHGGWVLLIELIFFNLFTLISLFIYKFILLNV